MQPPQELHAVGLCFQLAIFEQQAQDVSYMKVASLKTSKLFPLNVICRKKLSLEIVGDVEALVAWVRSKRMPMDRLSRERVLKRVEDPTQ